MVSLKNAPQPDPAVVERRQHPRFKAPEKTLAITSTIIGQILDISAGGCEVKFIDNNEQLAPRIAMDILMHDHGFYMEQVPVVMAWQDLPQSSALSTIIVRKIGVRFAELSPAQQEKIDFFIKNFTVGTA